MADPFTIDVWSDIACPWCWVGKRHLEQALRGSFDVEVAVRWHAFELNPDAPREAPESVDYVERLALKYGTSREEAQEMIDRMVATGRSAGLELRFDRIRPSSTFDAHRLLAWARGSGRATALKERLFSAYLHEGRPISDRDQLAALAGEIGLDPEAARALLEDDGFAAEVRADEETATRLGITGVPFFVFGRRLAVSGAQPAPVLVEAMERALSESRTTPV